MIVKRYQAYIGKRRLYVEGFLPDRVTGAPILCVPGAFDGSWIYRRFLRLMASRGHPAYAMNLRGYYKSRWKNVAELGVADYLSDIAAVRRALHIGRDAVLVGYSMSGPLVLASAARLPAGSIVLYDPDAPREIRHREVDKERVGPVVQFIPPRHVVTEMWGAPVTEKFYRLYLRYFEQTVLSGKAYREIFRNGVPVPPEKFHTPVLIIGTKGRNAAHSEMFHRFPCSWYAFDGFSHGMILFSPQAEILARFAAHWIEHGHPVGRRRFFLKKGPHLHLTAEDGMMHLYYLTSWNRAAVNIVGPGGEVLHRIPLRRTARGRWEGESTFEGRFLMSARTGFEVEGTDGEIDRPWGGGLYRPRAANATLADGSFHFGHAPIESTPPEYHDFDLRDDALDHDFHIRVRLPRDYPDRGPYPVAMINDGQNIWTNEGIGGGWWADRAADRMAAAGRMRDVVLVGLWCHRYRNRAYLPPPDGRGDLYLAFLRDRLLPLLRHRYEISHAPGETGILGASYGACSAVYLGLAAPETFGLVGALSFADTHRSPIRRWMRSLRRLPFRKFYLDAGTKWAHHQPHRDDNTRNARRMAGICRAKGMIDGMDFLHVIAQEQVHHEEAWRKRIPRALEFLFPPRVIAGRRGR